MRTYIRSEIEAEILNVARRENIPAPLLMRLCQVESDLLPWQVRYEPEYRWIARDWLTKSFHNEATELILQKCSWGLTQIMGSTARDAGFSGCLPNLVEPELNLTIACKLLGGLKASDRGNGTWRFALAAWNAGLGGLVDRPERLTSGYIVQYEGTLAALGEGAE